MKKLKVQAKPVAPAEPPPEVVAEAPLAAVIPPQDAAQAEPAPAAALQPPEAVTTEVAPPVSPFAVAVEQGAAVIAEVAKGVVAEGAHWAAGFVEDIVAATITVIGPAKGRWRAGRKFGPEATIITLADLTEAQFTALLDDPELVVTPTPAALLTA